MPSTLSAVAERPGFRRLRPVALFALLLLAACAGREAPPPADARPAARAARIAVPVEMFPELPPRVILVGTRPAELERLLGRPDLRRREPPAEYWRYSFTGCILDVFLFRRSATAAPEVIYFEFRNVMRAPGLDGCAEFAARFEPPALPEVREH